MRWAASFAAVAAAAVVGIGLWFVWPRQIAIFNTSLALTPVVQEGKTRVWAPGQNLIGSLGHYDDELYAFLMFDYVRSRKQFSGSEVLVDYKEIEGHPRYTLQLVCKNDLVTAVPRLFELARVAISPEPSWAFVRNERIERMRRQTALLAEAYAEPVAEHFEHLPPATRTQLVRRFLRFKSATDPRVRTQDSVLRALSKPEATELASDVIAVAGFYELPLEFLLGIGAMENNYLDVRGDLDHAVWKRRAQKGDIVIRRGRAGRVLVKNFSLGRWQITRETLRFAHSLYLSDSRDYNSLPERLRPDRTLDLESIRPAALTTYAGLLLRYLLDYFDGDLTRAVGAYNGGVARPNERYEAGVRRVAEYARRILGRAAAIKNANVSSLDSLANAPGANGARDRR